MFVPDAYRAADPAAIVRRHAFAVLTTATTSGELFATSLPLYFEHDERTDVLVGHLARRNPHAAAMQDGQPALAVFSGPNAYVSPRWYVEKPDVPTWNYVAAQARGLLEVIDEPEAQLAILRRTLDVEEAGSSAWALDNAPAGRVDYLLPMIRSFRVRIACLEGATKLSQTHPDRYRVAEALAASPDFGPQEIARLMRGLG